MEGHSFSLSDEYLIISMAYVDGIVLDGKTRESDNSLLEITNTETGMLLRIEKSNGI